MAEVEEPTPALPQSTFAEIPASGLLVENNAKGLVKVTAKGAVEVHKRLSGTGTVSELIAALSRIRDEHGGDLPVRIDHDVRDCGSCPRVDTCTLVSDEWDAPVKGIIIGPCKM